MNTVQASLKTLLLSSEAKFTNKDYQGAARDIELGLALEPNDASLWSNLGYTLYLQGEFDASERASRRAIAIDGKFTAAYSNLSLALTAKGVFAETLELLDTAIAIDPYMADLWINKGLVYLKGSQIPNAIASLEKAVSLDGESYIAITNLALCWQEVGLIEKAYATYTAALALNPSYSPAISNKLMCAQYHPGLGSAQLLDDAKQATSNLQQDVRYTDSDIALKRATNPKPRLGFFSADLRAHPVGWFLRDVFTRLAQDFDCYCYVNPMHPLDDVSAEFQRSAKAWINIKGWNTKQVSQQIEDDKIDILVDLAGHTAGNQLSLFTCPTSAKKVSWLGFPASTGLANMNGVLLSEDLVCEATQSFFSEPIIAIPSPQFVYRPPDYLPDISQTPGIRNGYVTFGCFNNLSKLNDSVLTCWAGLLTHLPTAKLILKWKTLADASVAERVLKRFHSLGIAAARIELRGASSHQDMLREYGDIDIALDPFPFSGALTSFEAIWMGVPVVTLYTLRPMSRQTYSINKALGLAELGAETPAQYIGNAAHLANDLSALNEMRLSMRSRIQQSALDDVETMSSNIAQALMSMVKP